MLVMLAMRVMSPRTPVFQSVCLSVCSPPPPPCPPLSPFLSLSLSFSLSRSLAFYLPPPLSLSLSLFPLPPSAPMGSPSRGGGVSRLSLPTPFSPIFVCPSAYRNLSPVLLFTHQLLPTYLQFSSSDCPFCLHRPFTYISLLYKPSFCHFSFSLWSTRDPAR